MRHRASKSIFATSCANFKFGSGLRQKPTIHTFPHKHPQGHLHILHNCKEMTEFQPEPWNSRLNISDYTWHRCFMMFSYIHIFTDTFNTRKTISMYAHGCRCSDMVVGLQETNRKRASSQEHRGDSPKWW